MKIKKTMIILVVTWISLISMSFLWNYRNAINEQERIALRSARSFFKQIVITRTWNANHSGLYVPVTEEIRPNPYLDLPMRDIKVSDSLTLTKVNPAYMTRQISEISREQDGVQFHMTSLNPIRPQNIPTEREANVLKEFEKDVKEKGMFFQEGEKTFYFYMAPLKTEKSCLQCHSKQGYKEGDIRGGISVVSPYVMQIPFVPLLLGHALIGGVGLLGILIFAGRLNKAYEIIKKQAVFDSLTGIPNRRSFSERLLSEYQRGRRNHQPLSLIMCDVDNFKAYNDTYGHQNGDICLKKIAEEVQSSLSRPGDFCARYGGEEFVVLLPNTTLDGAMKVAENILKHIEKMQIAHSKSLPKQIVTLSLGVATAEEAKVVSCEELVKQADVALYKAKERGKSQVRSFRDVAFDLQNNIPLEETQSAVC